MTAKTQSPLTVYYDGACPVCSREIDFYAKRTGGTVSYCDVAAEGRPAPDLDREQALQPLLVLVAAGLRRIAVPTHIVHGVADPLVPVAAAHDLHASVAGSTARLRAAVNHAIRAAGFPDRRSSSNDCCSAASQVSLKSSQRTIVPMLNAACTGSSFSSNQSA